MVPLDQGDAVGLSVRPDRTPYDIGYVFDAGFAIWSMHSRWALDLDPEADEDDERAVSEGVSVAPYAYFGQG